MFFLCINAKYLQLHSNICSVTLCKLSVSGNCSQKMHRFHFCLFFGKPQLSDSYSGAAAVITLYRVGHEKIACLPFCTCPCDILSGVSMHIA